MISDIYFALAGTPPTCSCSSVIRGIESTSKVAIFHQQPIRKIKSKSSLHKHFIAYVGVSVVQSTRLLFTVLLRFTVQLDTSFKLRLACCLTGTVLLCKYKG